MRYLIFPVIALILFISREANNPWIEIIGAIVVLMIALLFIYLTERDEQKD